MMMLGWVLFHSLIQHITCLYSTDGGQWHQACFLYRSKLTVCLRLTTAVPNSITCWKCLIFVLKHFILALFVSSLTRAKPKNLLPDDFRWRNFEQLYGSRFFTFVQYSRVTQSKFVSKQVNNVSFILKRLMCYQSFMRDTVSPLNIEECICTFQTV